jgi:hypothetical protein
MNTSPFSATLISASPNTTRSGADWKRRNAATKRQASRPLNRNSKNRICGQNSAGS